MKRFLKTSVLLIAIVVLLQTNLLPVYASGEVDKFVIMKDGQAVSYTLPDLTNHDYLKSLGHGERGNFSESIGGSVLSVYNNIALVKWNYYQENGLETFPEYFL